MVANSGSVRRRWSSRSRLESSACRSSRRAWLAGSAFSAGPFVLPASTRATQGSVGTVETSVLTVVPRCREPRAHGVGGRTKPGPFGGPMRHVDDRAPTVGEVLRNDVVAQVGGDKDLRAGRRGLAQVAIAGAAAHRDPTHRGAEIARDPAAARRRGQRRPDSRRERAQASWRLAVRRPGRCRCRRATRPARTRRTPAPRRGALLAARGRRRRATALGNTISIRVSSTRVTSPTAPMVGFAPTNGWNVPTPVAVQAQRA